MVKASKIVSLLIILSLVVLAIPFQPAEVLGNGGPSDVWVAPPPLGSNSNPGTQARPFATIQWGIDHAAPDGTVHVAAGTYYENLHIDRSLTLIGSDARTTIIDGDGKGRVLHIASLTGQTNTVSKFTIQNGHISWSVGGVPVGGGVGMPVGGGVYVARGHVVTLNDCTIKDNIADFLGGGVYNAGQITLNGCTLNGNSAAMVGGGIANFVDEKLLDSDGSMSLNNCTVYGNSVGQTSAGFTTSPEYSVAYVVSLSLGGGVYNGGDASFVNVTIANNTVSGSSEPQVGATNFFNVPIAYAEPVNPEPHGGGFANVPLQCINDEGDPIFTPVATFKNTIVANNLPENGYNNGGSVISSGYNLDSEDSCNFDQPTDLINTDPLLGPLQNNGGPTFTSALLHGSPAIDNGGDPGVTDQRGVPRPQGSAFDIGAYELAQASVATDTGTGTAYFSTLNGYITDLTALDEGELDCPPNEALDFPHGLFSFTITGITPGSTVTIVIILPSDVPTDTQYWKCIDGQWVDCTSLLDSNNGDSVLMLTITDGGLGDRDGVANGTIVDPGGPVLVFRIGPSQPESPRALVRTPANMSIQYMSINPKQVYANQTVTITTNVANTGGETGSLNVILKINDKVEQAKAVIVGPQGTQPVKFTVTETQAGTYNVDIGGQKGSFTVLGAGGSAEGSSSSDRMIAILIVIAVLVIAVVLLVWMLISRSA